MVTKWQLFIKYMKDKAMHVRKDGQELLMTGMEILIRKYNQKKQNKNQVYLLGRKDNYGELVNGISNV